MSQEQMEAVLTCNPIDPIEFVSELSTIIDAEQAIAEEVE